MMIVRIPLWTWPVAGVAPTLPVSRSFVPATRSAPTWGGGLVKIGALRRPVGRAFMLGCFCRLHEKHPAFSAATGFAAATDCARGEPNGLAQGQCSGRFGIDRDGLNLVGFAASVRSSITLAVARISG